MVVIVPSISSKEVNDALGWIQSITKLFTPFKPETRKLLVNYRSKRSEIHLFLTIPDGIRRKTAKVEIPHYGGFKVLQMLDETFQEVDITSAWTTARGNWAFDPSKLPSSEKFLVVMSGSAPETMVDRLVRVQPALNRDSTEDVDRFWLDSMIRNPEVIELMWQSLDIDEVNVGVRVGVEQIFAACLPKEMKRQLEVTQQLMQASHGRDRNALFKAWARVRATDRDSDFSISQIVQMIENLSTGEMFSRYVSIDAPYEVGEIGRSTLFKGGLPELMSVEAKTVLNLKKQPVARGFLAFKKKEYQEKLENAFDAKKETS